MGHHPEKKASSRMRRLVSSKSQSVILRCPLQAGPELLLVLLAHHAVQFLLCILLPLQLGFLLLLLLLEEVFVLGVMHRVGCLLLVVVDCAQRSQQLRHLSEYNKAKRDALVHVSAINYHNDAIRLCC